MSSETDWLLPFLGCVIVVLGLLLVHARIEMEQRIGRLDRIGQTQDIDIHVPFLENTAQQTLLDWYDKGLNLFLAKRPKKRHMQW